MASWQAAVGDEGGTPQLLAWEVGGREVAACVPYPEEPGGGELGDARARDGWGYGWSLLGVEGPVSSETRCSVQRRSNIF